MTTKRVKVLDELTTTTLTSTTTKPVAVVKLLLTDIEAGQALGVSASYVRRLVAAGHLKRVQLPASRGAGKTRVLRLAVSDIEALIARSKEPVKWGERQRLLDVVRRR